MVLLWSSRNVLWAKELSQLSICIGVSRSRQTLLLNTGAVVEEGIVNTDRMLNTYLRVADSIPSSTWGCVLEQNTEYLISVDCLASTMNAQTCNGDIKMLWTKVLYKGSPFHKSAEHTNKISRCWVYVKLHYPLKMWSCRLHEADNYQIKELLCVCVPVLRK